MQIRVCRKFSCSPAKAVQCRPVSYIGEAVKIARKYFRVIGIEIYPLNVDEYAYLHECGVDYVTVFQETYDADKYKTRTSAGISAFSRTA